MRILATLLLAAIAGCTAADRTAPAQTDEPEWYWPFELPAWSQPLSESEAAQADAGQPGVILLCEFVNAGSFAVQLAGLLGVSAEQGVVLDADPVDGLRRMTADVEDGSIVSFPYIVVRESRPTWVSIQHPSGERRVFLRCSEIGPRTASVRFAADTARRTDSGEWDVERSWRVEGQEVLEVGQAIVSHGGLEEDGNPALVIIQLTGYPLD
jgi:hypothetical protein